MIFKNRKTVIDIRTAKYQVALSDAQVTELTKMLKSNTVNYTRKNRAQISLDLNSKHGEQYKRFEIVKLNRTSSETVTYVTKLFSQGVS